MYAIIQIQDSAKTMHVVLQSWLVEHENISRVECFFPGAHRIINFVNKKVRPPKENISQDGWDILPVRVRATNIGMY